MKSLYSTVSKYVKSAAVAAALPFAMSGTADAATNIIYSVNNTLSPNESFISMKVENNNSGVILNSAAVKLEEMLTPAMDYFRQHSTITGSPSWTFDDFISNGIIDINIKGAPTGEVYNGWTATNNSGVVDLTNNGSRPDISYDVWYGSDVPNQNMLALEYTFNTDLNQNGVREANEHLVNLTHINGSVVVDGFEGVEGVFSYSAHVEVFTFAGDVPAQVERVLGEAKREAALEVLGLVGDGSEVRVSFWVRGGLQYALMQSADLGPTPGWQPAVPVLRPEEDGPVVLDVPKVGGSGFYRLEISLGNGSSE